MRNKGLEPTTLAEVYFYSDNRLLDNLKMINRLSDEIRIEPNDRKIFILYVSKDVLLQDEFVHQMKLNAKLIFKTTHKNISKKIRLIQGTNVIKRPLEDDPEDDPI